MSANLEVEYRVIPVTRYIVTRHYAETLANGGGSIGCDERGEFNNRDIAHEVATSLADREHQTLGYALDDPRMKFPKSPGVTKSAQHQCAG